ncbi:MAG: hypothetical protein EXR07_00775 [Acetobacteraceae bacterium]|nr:hypothetical protein [Acetobacteraceae bacterium]
MRQMKTLLIAAPVMLGMFAAPAAHAEWRGHGGWGPHAGGWSHHGGHRGPGGLLAGALLGLGVAAVAGGIIAAQQPAPVYYAPQPAYYPAPGYYVPQGYYAPQAYYGQREYSGQ